MPAKRVNSCSGAYKKNSNKNSLFDVLHDDLLISILAKLISTANSPNHFVNAMLTCRRFCSTARHPQVLAHASLEALAVKASKWSEDAHQFLKRCAEAGNMEARYTLGMIQFYCLMIRGSGVALMAEAAIASHPVALYSLAVIHFNGSGGLRKDKNLKKGVILSAKSAALGHVDAIREVGHCLQDGYGVKKNVAEGRRFLVEANAREAEAAAKESATLVSKLKFFNCNGSCASPHLQYQTVSKNLDGSLEGSTRNYNPENWIVEGGGGSLLSDFGCNVPPAKVHVANSFLVEWFALHPPAAGFRLCSYSKCGRIETRRHEFRRCSVCGSVNYCSRACQALDWKIEHRYICRPVADWEEQEEIDIDEHDGEDHIASDDLDEA
eukprot:Gb_13419 [translate_table: standard]